MTSEIFVRKNGMVQASYLRDGVFLLKFGEKEGSQVTVFLYGNEVISKLVEAVEAIQEGKV